MDVSMESIEGLERETEAHNEGLLFGEQPEPTISSRLTEEDPGALMPPPHGPPSAIPPHLAQSLAGSSYLSPSKEGEVPMEFSPGVKKYIEKGFTKLSPKAQGTTFSRLKSRNSLESPGTKSLGQESGSEMHPADIFTQSPGSPSSKFKAMLDEIDVNERANDSSDEDFLKRQQKPIMRRCRSLEMRKRLFDMSNTPPNAFKPVFKRPAIIDEAEGDRNYTKIAKRPKDLRLSTVEEANPCPVVKEVSEEKNIQHEPASGGEASDHERIKVAVDALQSPDVIGDCSREHCLPVMTGKHSDLKNIGHETMAFLLNDGYKGKFDKLTVIDCRYPYEYKGGHILGAVNLYTEEDIKAFLKKEMDETASGKSHTHILVFHCEFSSQRGPGLLRHLRKLDREMNILHYPKLTFPEMYVLHLGYKEFFSNHPHLCIPSAYIPMADESYVNDLKHFRAKAKSWTAGERTRSSKR